MASYRPSRTRKRACALVLFLILFASSLAATAFEEAQAPILLLKQGKEALESARLDEAVTLLARASEEFPLLADYALYYLADAYHRSGRQDESLATIHSLLERFPQTPLRRKALLVELRATEALENRQALTGLYEQYLRTYPDDEAVTFSYALLLKKCGKAAQARPLFRQLFVKAGSRAQEARQELAASDISPSDIIERATNLMKKYDFDDAEKELKALLAKGAEGRAEAQRHLATALFKQKKYREAADMYDRVNDLYSKTRSLYRAGEKERFNAALEKLVRQNDQRAGYILNAVAADRRRECNFDEAIRIYRDVQKNYPSDREEATWGLGWTHYAAGNFEEAQKVFAQLHSQHNDPKYLYWQARCIEALGDDPAPQYAKLMKLDNNFYAVLAFSRTGAQAATPASSKRPSGNRAPLSAKSERIDALISLDMRSEAIAELSEAARKADSAADLEFLLLKYSEIGEYRRAIGLATKLPYSEATHPFWYPRAFWETLEPVSRKYQIEPHIALSVMREESRFDPAVKSPAGAYGLMQLMPQTAYRLDRTLKMGVTRPSQLTNPQTNISLGVYYLNLLLAEFDHSLPHALAAYNAGEIAVRNWVQRGGERPIDVFIEDIPYQETRNYVKKVLTSYFQYRRSDEHASPTAFDLHAGL